MKVYKKGFLSVPSLWISTHSSSLYPTTLLDTQLDAQLNSSQHSTHLNSLTQLASITHSSQHLFNCSQLNSTVSRLTTRIKRSTPLFHHTRPTDSIKQRTKMSTQQTTKADLAATHQTAKTQYVSTPNGHKFAYRRIGSGSGVPLIVLTHFRGVMDKFDPLVINNLAARRTVITVDYSGVGLSTGPVATTVSQSADDMLLFLSLIGESEVDILGFSLGGMVAQLMALNTDPAKVRVRKLILTGTTPSAGLGLASSPNDDVNTIAGGQNVSLEALKTLFFPKNRDGEAAAEAFWARIHERSEETSGEKPATWVSQGYADGAAGLQAEANQLGGWVNPEATQGRDGSFARLKELDIPVLVANGHNDYMIPTVNSFVLQQQVPNGQLVVYPNSGHGFIFQYAKQFVPLALSFLED